MSHRTKTASSPPTYAQITTRNTKHSSCRLNAQKHSLSNKTIPSRTWMSRPGFINHNRCTDHIFPNNRLVNSKKESCKVFMTGVPRLKRGSWESEESLINKVTHWIRKVRNCRRLIRSDIVEASRHLALGGEG